MTAYEAIPEGVPALLLIGTGERCYLQDALESLAARYRVLLLDDTAPTWRQPFLTDHRIADLGDQATLGAAASLAAAHDIGGVLTWTPAATATARFLQARATGHRAAEADRPG